MYGNEYSMNLIYAQLYILWQVIIMLYYCTLNKMKIILFFIPLNSILLSMAYLYFKHFNDEYQTGEFFLILFVVLSILYFILWIILRKEKGFDLLAIYNDKDQDRKNKITSKVFKIISRVFQIISNILKIYGLLCLTLSIALSFLYINKIIITNKYRLYIYLILLIINGITALIISNRYTKITKNT